MAITDRSHENRMDRLTKFRRDSLFAIAAVGPAKGLEIKAKLEDYYGTEVNHGQLYPNLDTLVDHGLVKKGSMDKRTNSYELTDAGRAVLEARREWEQECLEGVSA